MAWQTLAEGTDWETFKASRPPVSELPKGTKLRLTIETPWYLPIAPLADLVGAEWVAQRFLNEGGAIMKDVEGQGFNRIVVHMEADPAWLVPLIVCIAVIAGGVCTVIALAKLEAIVPAVPQLGWVALVAIALAVIAVAWQPKQATASDERTHSTAGSKRNL